MNPPESFSDSLGQPERRDLNGENLSPLDKEAERIVTLLTSDTAGMRAAFKQGGGLDLDGAMKSAISVMKEIRNFEQLFVGPDAPLKGVETEDPVLRSMEEFYRYEGLGDQGFRDALIARQGALKRSMAGFFGKELLREAETKAGYSIRVDLTPPPYDFAKSSEFHLESGILQERGVHQIRLTRKEDVSLSHHRPIMTREELEETGIEGRDLLAIVSMGRPDAGTKFGVFSIPQANNKGGGPQPPLYSLRYMPNSYERRSIQNLPEEAGKDLLRGPFLDGEFIIRHPAEGEQASVFVGAAHGTALDFMLLQASTDLHRGGQEPIKVPEEVEGHHIELILDGDNLVIRDNRSEFPEGETVVQSAFIRAGDTRPSSLGLKALEAA